MNVNRRLTAPPLHEVELVTNSVCAILPMGDSKKPEAGGNTLDISSFFNGFVSRMLRTLRPARIFGWMQRKVEPVSATQFLFVSQGAASGS